MIENSEQEHIDNIVREKIILYKEIDELKESMEEGRREMKENFEW